MTPIAEDHHIDPKAPPLDEAQQQLDAALAMQALAGAIKAPQRPEISMDSEPKAASDRAARARVSAMALSSDNEAARAVLRSLGIDPDQLFPDLSRHSELWSAYEDVKVIRRGARNGRRICDRFRQIAAAMVDIEAVALLDATPGDQQKSALISDLRDIHNAKLDRIKDQQDAQQQVAKIERTARDRVKDLEARTRLHEAMAAMRKGEDLPWEQVMEAVDTYRALYGDDLDEDDPPAPGPADRRDRDRLH